MAQESMIEMYLAQVRHYEVLTHEQEMSLANEISKGSDEARQKLINSNLKLVVSIAEKHTRDEHLLLDLIQEGNMGLMMAVNKFSRSFNVRFSTYAYPWITQYILRYLQQKVPIIYLPSRKEEEVRRVKKTQTYLQMMLGREPSLGEVAAYLDVSESFVRETLTYSFACSSIHSELKKGEGLTCEDVLEDERSSVEQTGFRNLVAEDIRRMVDTLPRAERQVIYYRFSFDRDAVKCRTLRQIGGRIGCSTETVRKLELKALRSLKRIAQRTMSV